MTLTLGLRYHTRKKRVANEIYPLPKKIIFCQYYILCLFWIDTGLLTFYWLYLLKNKKNWITGIPNPGVSTLVQKTPFAIQVLYSKQLNRAFLSAMTMVTKNDCQRRTNYFLSKNIAKGTTNSGTSTWLSVSTQSFVQTQVSSSHTILSTFATKTTFGTWRELLNAGSCKGGIFNNQRHFSSKEKAEDSMTINFKKIFKALACFGVARRKVGDWNNFDKYI